MEIHIDLGDTPGVPPVALSVPEFKLHHDSDKEIYPSIGAVRMAANRLLRNTPSLREVDISHHIRSDTEYTTEEFDTVEKKLVIDLDL